LAPALEATVIAWGARPQTIDSIVLYELPGAPPVTAEFPLDVVFGGELLLVGYDVLSPCPPSPCEWLTYWRVEAAAAGPRRFFLHLVAEEGQVVAQDDRMGAPAAHWRPGDVIVQQHAVGLPENMGAFTARLGVYDPETLVRLPAAGGGDNVVLDGAQ
jgi:hypothetical protein